MIESEIFVTKFDVMFLNYLELLPLFGLNFKFNFGLFVLLETFLASANFQQLKTAKTDDVSGMVET